MKRISALLLLLILCVPSFLHTQTTTWNQKQDSAHAASPDSTITCPSKDYYINRAGQCVHRPVQSQNAPAGATAQCRDGTYSFSQSRRGTCSHHGGVSKWITH